MPFISCYFSFICRSSARQFCGEVLKITLF